MRRRLISICGLLLIAPCVLAAVRGSDAMYVGGTLPGLAEKTKGKFEISDDAARFRPASGTTAVIPYKGIVSLEYGQKAGRRVGAAVAVTPVLLFSKKRKHYLSVRYTDEAGATQGAVFELSKGTVRGIIEALETRSGKKVEFESEDARKHLP